MGPITHIMSCMRRYVIAGSAVLLTIVFAAALLSRFNRPTEMDYRLARAGALLDAENYLQVLEILRDLPEGSNGSEPAHSYLGAAYLGLHLYQGAIRELEEAVRISPRAIDPHIGLASAYIQLGDAAKAVEEAKRATQIESRSLDAWVALGRSYWQMQNFAEAEKAALKARELDAQNSAVSELLLHIYFEDNQARKFVAELDRVSYGSRDVQNLAIRFFIREDQFAHAYDLSNRYEQSAIEHAIFEAELALKREPKRTDLYPALIKNLVRTGRFQQAIDLGKNYAGAIAVDFELGKAYWMAGRADEAIRSFGRASEALVHKLPAEVALHAITGNVEHWREAYKAERPEQDYFILARIQELLDNRSPLIRSFAYRYAALFDMRFYNKAAEEALHVLDENTENFDALMTIATAYQHLGRIDDATRYVERAREAYPRRAEPVSRLASLALAAEDKDVTRIVSLMEQAVRLEPGNAGYLYNLGWMYEQIGNTGKAVDMYEKAIRASPLSFEAMNNLALVYQSQGEGDRALPLLNRAIHTDPDSEVAYFNVANAYVERREWRQALDNYARVLQINPANAIAAIEAGRIYIELGRLEDAIVNLNRALDVDPHSTDAYLLLSSAYQRLGHGKEAMAASEEAERTKKDVQKR
jgi:tetratricopeptide (TPR) repeat protein